MSSFNERVQQLLKKIPHGKLTTYKQLAIALGNPKAARAVGNACRRNPYPGKVPCHRVVKSSGEIGGYAKGRAKKIALLRSEGIIIKKGKVPNLNEILFTAKQLR